MKKDEQYSILYDKFQEWFDDPGQGYIPTPEAEAKHLNHRRHRRHKRHVVNSAKLIEGLFIGFVGVFLCGIGLYIFNLFANSIIEGW